MDQCCNNKKGNNMKTWLKGNHVNASAAWKNFQILWVVIIILTPQGGRGEGDLRCEWCKSNRSSFHTFMSKFTLQCIRFKRLAFLVIYLTCPSWQLGRKHVLHSPGPPSVSKRLKQKQNKDECYFYNTGFHDSFYNSKVYLTISFV